MTSAGIAARHRLAAALAAFALLLPVSSVEAQTANRAWVSGHGTDVGGCGAPTAPCRSFQYTHDNIVVAGGEIDVLDPAGFGAITITKSISIINDGAGTAGVQATSGSAITVNAASATIVLRGLDIEGEGADNGLRVLTGGSLTVLDCTVNGFANFGLQYEPSASGYIYVSKTRLTNNGADGVVVVPQISSGSGLTVQATFERIDAVNNGAGVLVQGAFASTGATVYATLADSVTADNAIVGVESASSASGAPTFLMVRNTTVVNAGVGGFADGATLEFAHSTLTGNTTVFGTSSGGVVGSYGDNDVDGNGAPGITPTHLTQF